MRLDDVKFTASSLITWWVINPEHDHHLAFGLFLAILSLSLNFEYLNLFLFKWACTIFNQMRSVGITIRVN